jgi:hypothetical protein
VLSFVNLAGAFLALTTLGSIEPWTDAQFVGMFGLIETGLGLAFLFAPNAWRLPVAEADTRRPVRLAASTLLIPHWLAAARAFGGLVMLAYAAGVEGAGLATLGMVPVVLLIATSFLAFAVAAARIGVARPDLDVFWVSIRRPGHEPQELPGMSITGVIVQFISNIGIFPAIELLSPGVLYQPEIGPSAAVLAATAAAAAISAAIAFAAWQGRIAWRAPREQEREAERELAAEA